MNVSWSVMQDNSVPTNCLLSSSVTGWETCPGYQLTRGAKLVAVGIATPPTVTALATASAQVMKMACYASALVMVLTISTADKHIRTPGRTCSSTSQELIMNFSNYTCKSLWRNKELKICQKITRRPC